VRERSRKPGLENLSFLKRHSELTKPEAEAQKIETFQ